MARPRRPQRSEKLDNNMYQVHHKRDMKLTLKQHKRTIEMEKERHN